MGFAQVDDAGRKGTRERRKVEDRRMLKRYAATGDPELRKRLVLRFLPLARSLAYRHHHPREGTEDLIQVACVGLLAAIDRFDPSVQSSFAAFAAPTIVGEIRHHLRDHGDTLRISRTALERYRRVQGAAEELRSELGRRPRTMELAERCRLTDEQVSTALLANDTKRLTSLDKPITAEGLGTIPLSDTVGGTDLGYERVETRQLTETAGLSEHERKAMVLRFDHDMTQSEIGEVLGVSQVQISRLLRRALGAIEDQIHPERHREAEDATDPARSPAGDRV